MLETPTATRADGWRPTHDQAFIDRFGWIGLAATVSFSLAHLLRGDASFFAAVYGAYFVARFVEHGVVRAQFWLSTIAFALAAAILVAGTALWIDPIAAGVMALAAVATIALGVGRRIHATTALLVFVPALLVWLLTDGRLSDIGALSLAAAAPLVLLPFRRASRHALAERIRGGVRLDSGEVYTTHGRGVLRLRDRSESEPRRTRFMVWSGPLASPMSGRLVIRCRDCSRCRALQGAGVAEHHRSIAGVPIVVAFDRVSALTEALARGALDDALEALCALRHPLVVVDEGTVHVETMSQGDDAAEILVRFARAIEAHAEETTRGAYR